MLFKNVILNLFQNLFDEIPKRVRNDGFTEQTYNLFSSYATIISVFKLLNQFYCY